MKYTLVPPNDPPKRYTASTAKMNRLLEHSPNGDLTINQTRNDLLPGPVGIDFEMRLRELFKNIQS